MTPGTDEERVFIVGRGEIRGRIDAFYWQPKFHAMDAIFAMLGARVAKLGSIAYGLTNGDHGGVQYTESGIRYLRGQSVTELGLDLEKDTKFIADSEHKRMIRAEVVNGDVLYTIAGSIGNACLVSGVERANINQAIVRIKPGPVVIGQYLCDFLNSNIGKLQSRRIANGGVQLNINFTEVKALKVLLPELDVQEKFVEQLANARHAYKTALNKADELLASIDEYLLSELGVTLPPKSENIIANRIFMVQRKELTGWRFDPLSHSFELWQAIEEAHVPTKKLGLCCHYLKTGFAAGGDMQLFDNSGVVQLRPTNIDTNRELVFGRNVYLDKSVLMDRPDDVVRPGEVIFNNTNSQELVGKTAYMDIDGESFVCSNHMTRIAVIEDELDAEYLTSLLNAYQRLKVFFSLCTNWNNQSGVNVDLLRQLPIPLPSKEKQMVIAGNIRAIRQEAKRLRQTAETELDAAKCRIEAILFGEETA